MEEPEFVHKTLIAVSRKATRPAGEPTARSCAEPVAGLMRGRDGPRVDLPDRARHRCNERGHVRDIRRASECKSLMMPLMAPYAAKHRSKRGGPNHHYDHTGFPRARRARSYHLAFRAVAHGIRLRRCRREGEEPAQRAEPCAPIGWAYPRAPAWECFRIPPSSAKPAAVGARRSL